MTINTGGTQVQEWLEVGNGCICCSVKYIFPSLPFTILPIPFFKSRTFRDLLLTKSRDSGVNAIESLMEKRGAFDYILLETTGLADPGNLAPLFWVDEGLGSTIYLDGIVTLVDAKNVMKSLDETVGETVLEREGKKHEGKCLTTAHLQISHADLIVINKADLVTKEELEEVRDRIEGINGLAKVVVTERGRVGDLLQGNLLDLHAYDQVGSLDVDGRAWGQSFGHHHLDEVSETIGSWSIVGLMTLDNQDGRYIDTCSSRVPNLKARRLVAIHTLGFRGS